MPPFVALTRQLLQDLKAGNVLVGDSGLCKISGFGMAKAGDINTTGVNTSLQGSVFWMAPEVVGGQKGYDSKIDIWGVGCVVFEMWTGERPWNEQDTVAVLLQVCIRFDRLSGLSLLSPFLSSAN